MFLGEFCGDLGWSSALELVDNTLKFPVQNNLSNATIFIFYPPSGFCWIEGSFRFRFWVYVVSDPMVYEVAKVLRVIVFPNQVPGHRTVSQGGATRHIALHFLDRE